MKLSIIALAGGYFLVTAATAGVRVFVEASNGMAWLKYECSAGEVLRAFALDVTVDKGQITGISNFFTGPCTAVARGYGIFPAAFRDHVTVSSGSSANWSVSGYNPIASTSDAPADTLPGLGTNGVTLEFGALWDPALPANAPPASGTLCALQLSQAATVQSAHVTVAANASRGGVTASPDGNVVAPTFTGAYVGPPQIVSISLVNGSVKIVFAGGELEYAWSLDGTWSGTGDTSGTHTESLDAVKTKFFRVHQH